MIWYVIRRCAQSVIVIVIVSALVFLLAHISGNPVGVLVPPDAPADVRQAVIHELGLDRPLVVQYWIFVVHALHGNFGNSIRFQEPAMQLVLSRFPATAELALVAFAIAAVVGLTLGVTAALRNGRLADHAVVSGLAVAQAIPSFWAGILMILVFGVALRLLPFVGQDGWRSFVMPALTLALLPTVIIARVTRSSITGILSRDYVRTAKAKGLRSHGIVLHHVLRNGMIPIITIGGLVASELLSGAIITEQIFSWPGIGSLSVQAIEARDYAVIQAVTLLTSCIVLGLNLVIDLTYAWLDPTVRIGEVRA